MMVMPGLFLLPLLLVSSPDRGDPPEGGRDGDPRRLVGRSAPFLEREGVAWIEKRKCVTCHQVPSMLWSLNASHAAGIAGDPEKLARWTAWSTDWKHWVAPGRESSEAELAVNNPDTLAQLLLGRADTKGAEPDWTGRFAGFILDAQQADGSWKAGGQLPLQDRPKREGDEVSTMWALLALHSSGRADAAVEEPTRRALAWLKEGDAGKSTEWWVARSLLEQGMGHDEEAKRLAEDLITRQNPDGGWGWLRGKRSDAFGTGLALYALGRVGKADHRDPIRKAHRFLADTQKDDGSWPVPGTRTKDAGRITATATYWGTAWATLGLLTTMDEPPGGGAGSEIGRP